ncbi:MAG: hypothetical protein FWG10_01565 [Eubacteriaceae bacterium]|nr:hypothetical protein [Eubacteriaceae bacterium]
MPVHLFYQGIWTTRYTAMGEIFNARYCLPDSFYDYAYFSVSAGFLLKEDVFPGKKRIVRNCFARISCLG